MVPRVGGAGLESAAQTLNFLHVSEHVLLAGVGVDEPAPLVAFDPWHRGPVRLVEQHPGEVTSVWEETLLVGGLPRLTP